MQVTAKALLAWAGASLIFVGVAAFGLGLTIALQSRFGVAGGAMLSGLILLAPPAAWAMISALAGPSPAIPAQRPDAIVTALSALAREKPLQALAGAVLFGAADMLLRRRK